MNPFPIDLSLSLAHSGGRSRAEQLADRVRLVLETERGQVPFLPEFGCELTGMVGTTASQSRLSEVRLRINSALNRWVPDATIASCKVELVEPVVPSSRHPSVPVAERALASRGLAAVLEVRVVIETPDGPVEIEAQMNP